MTIRAAVEHYAWRGNHARGERAAEAEWAAALRQALAVAEEGAG